MSIKKELKYNIDFVVVNERVWDLIHNTFGGGPAIPLFAI